jgi:putative membrane protein
MPTATAPSASMRKAMRIEINKKIQGRLSFAELVSSWLINSVGLLIVSRGIKGIEFHGEGIQGILVVLAAGAVLGLINVLIKPVLLVLTLPINVLSLGLFTLVINAACLGLVGMVVQGFEVAGFWPALLGALMLSLISMMLNAVVLIGGFKVKIQK